MTLDDLGPWRCSYWNYVKDEDYNTINFKSNEALAFKAGFIAALEFYVSSLSTDLHELSK